MDEKVKTIIEYNFRKEIERARAIRPTLGSLATPVYKDDATLEMFRPGEPMTSAEHHREMLRLAGIAEREYGLTIDLVEIDAENYPKWLEETGHRNSAATRAIYINSMLGNELRGGKRAGQGRKLEADAKRKAINITLSPAELAKLDEMRGEESRSEYIRRKLGL